MDASSDQPICHAPQLLPVRVGIVLVNYNSEVDIMLCLSSIRGLDYLDHFIVIVDNNSPDGSGERLRREIECDDVVVILSPRNQGFAAANNLGIAYAKARGAQFVWLLNADTTVETQALSALVEAAEQNPLTAAFGSKVLYGQLVDEKASQGNKEARIWGAGGLVDFAAQTVEMRGAGQADKGQLDETAECDYLPGCSLFVRMSAVATAGYMPEEYFMYFEETDWCSRMRQAGFGLRYVPKSIVWHHFEDAKTQQPFGVYYFNRNRRFFWYRYGNLQQRVKLILRTVFVDLHRAVYAGRRAPDAKSRAVFRAHADSCIDFLLGRLGRSETYSRR